jgi:hypothetical protein
MEIEEEAGPMVAIIFVRRVGITATIIARVHYLRRGFPNLRNSSSNLSRSSKE